MNKSTMYFIIAAIIFFVSMIMSYCSLCFAGTAAGIIFVVLELSMVISGWVVWGIGIVNYFQRR